MSEKNQKPEQLVLPFPQENSRIPSAQVFSIQDHRLRIEASRLKDSLTIKVREKEILDRILERAERLSWYK